MVLDELLAAAAAERQTELARAAVAAEIRALAERLEARGAERSPLAESALERIRRWEERGLSDRPGAPVPELPPGSPIGGGG